MTEDKKQKLEEDLKKLVKKYNIKNFAFSGNDGEEYIGLLIAENTLMANMFEIICGVGRLWQHARTVTRDMLNEFEN